MTGTFRGASSFNGSVSDWDVHQVKSMDSMFDRASSFNNNVTQWDVSGLRTAERM